MSDYNNENIFSKRLRAGKRRTYFFDVRTTKNNDYFVTLTESKKRYDSEGYDRHKIFLYKEDFNKFIDALNETINHVKTELMPDFDFDAFSHDDFTPPPHTASAPVEIVPLAVENTPEATQVEAVAYEQAEEIKTPAIEQPTLADNKEVENPSANDDAQTW